MINERAQLIKTAIAEELAKEGMSLADLEQALEKNAAGTLFDISKVMEIPSMFWNIGGGSALGAGIAAGTGAYGMYRMNEDSNNKIMKKLQERQQYIKATNQLKADMENPIHL